MMNMSNFEERDNFLLSVKEWEEHYGCKIKDRPERGRIFSDLKQARSMLLNALPNAFHYLHDARIAKTTNLAEGYFSFIKTVIVIIAGFLLENVKHFLTGSFFWKNEKIAHIFCHYTRSDKYEGRRYFPSVDMTIYVQDTILESISGGLKWPQLPLPRMIEKLSVVLNVLYASKLENNKADFLLVCQKYRKWYLLLLYNL